MRNKFDSMSLDSVHHMWNTDISFRRYIRQQCRINSVRVPWLLCDFHVTVFIFTIARIYLHQEEINLLLRQMKRFPSRFQSLDVI